MKPLFEQLINVDELVIKSLCFAPLSVTGTPPGGT